MNQKTLFNIDKNKVIKLYFSKQKRDKIMELSKFLYDMIQ